ncbi:MAG: TonB-dependent receptor [Desulfobacterales bacterium]|nr:TonB-dependent receptor [Desulfobacterales bacterium]
MKETRKYVGLDGHKDTIISNLSENNDGYGRLRYENGSGATDPYVIDWSGGNVWKAENNSQVIRARYKGSAFTLLSITSRSDYKTQITNDADFGPFDFHDQNFLFDNTTWSQEIRFSSPDEGKPFSWVGGVFASRDKTTADSETLDYYYDRKTRIESDSIAVFGQGSYSLWNRLHLTAGVRYEHQESEATQINTFASIPGFDIFDADIACRKLALKKDTPEGVYLIEVASQKRFYTRYTDKKGRKRLALKPKDEVRDVEKSLFSVQYQAFAKSYLCVGEWENPQPAGHGLEITPLTDLSEVRAGDMVEFDVRFNGKPLSYSPTGIEYITACGTGFGLQDGFALFSYVSKGKAKFRVQDPGQWLVNIFHNEAVTPDGPLSGLHNKATSANYGATLTFTAK